MLRKRRWSCDGLLLLSNKIYCQAQTSAELEKFRAPLTRPVAGVLGKAGSAS